MRLIIISLLLISTLSGCSWFSPVVDPIYNEQPMLVREESDKKLITSLRESTDPMSDLKKAWDNDLRSRIVKYLERSGRRLGPEATVTFFQTVGDQQLVVETKNGELEGKVLAREVIIQVAGDKNNENNGKYFLFCMNGIISKIPDSKLAILGLATDESVVSVPKIETPSLFIAPKRFIIKAGFGLMDKLTFTEVKATAEALNLKTWTKNHKFFVLVQPGECFEKVPGQVAWERC